MRGAFWLVPVTRPSHTCTCDMYTHAQIEITESGAITLTKADPHELQRKANKFRQGYKNWRQKKPQGALGLVGLL